MSDQTAETGTIPEWDLADRFRKALRHAHLGVGDMATYLDVSRNTVSNWIHGHVQPSVQTQRLWALRTGVPYTWLARTPHPDGDGTDPASLPIARYRYLLVANS